MKVLSLFTGAGGLDIGFEKAGFEIVEAVEHDPDCAATLRVNRPQWSVQEIDVRRYEPRTTVDVITAGVPCQGFSISGRHDPNDSRNRFYREVLRIAKLAQPKLIIIENVPYMAVMRPIARKQPFTRRVARGLRAVGYGVHTKKLNLCRFGVPQTRNRLFVIGTRVGWTWPQPDAHTASARHALEPPEVWGIESAIVTETGKWSADEDPVFIRLGRTGSTGRSIRGRDELFATVDTTTKWAWAQGSVRADRNGEGLWRFAVGRARAFTTREYARLQTFPDDWVFCGSSSSTLAQIGNAVPPVFAERLAIQARDAIEKAPSKLPLEGGFLP